MPTPIMTGDLAPPGAPGTGGTIYPGSEGQGGAPETLRLLWRQRQSDRGGRQCVTMRSARLMKALVVAAAILCCATGCSSLLSTGSADVAGAGGAAIASAVTTNPAIAAGIGLGVQAVARTGVHYAQRQIHGAVQDEIARAAGNLRVGAVGTWRTHHQVPLEKAEHGRLTVSRVIGGGAALQCKEVVFSVDSEQQSAKRSAYYVVPVCREGATWKWASAEPATTRWGSLQ
ncbi:MAG: hypothetical protein QOK44_2806 [Betaproteobacteria bacterium]|nr:hypothetical protein [Betaproteobacteria bacterium]